MQLSEAKSFICEFLDFSANQFRSKLFAVFIGIFLSGCASVYKGPTPNFELKNQAAAEEFEKFKFAEGYWSQGPEIFKMGPSQTPYEINSLKPVITAVSPAAWKKVESQKYLQKIALFNSIVLAGILVSEMSDNDYYLSKDQSFVLWPMVIYNFTIPYFRAHFMAVAAKEYNRDLKEKLIPAIGVSFPLE